MRHHRILSRNLPGLGRARPNTSGPRPWQLLTAVLLLGLVAAVSLAQQPVPAHEPDATVERSAVPDLFKWNLSQLFASDAAWEKAHAALLQEVSGLKEYRGRLADPAVLKSCLDLYFRLHDEINHVTLYANLQLNTNLTDEKLQARQQRSLALLDELMRSASFLREEIMGFPTDAIRTIYEAADGPKQYRTYLENMRRRQNRVLAPEAERIMSMAGDNLWAEIDLNEIPSPLEDAFIALLTDIPWPMVRGAEGEPVQLTLSNYGRFRINPDRAVRKDAVTKFMATLRQYQHALAATLTGQYELDVFYARARGYGTALEAYLDKDNLTPETYDNLLTTVNANLEPLHRYVELRKQALGLDSLHLYDLYVPFVAGVDTDVPFAEGQRILTKALAPLGKEYGRVLAEGLDPSQGWLDLYPSLNKESGAFSASVYGRHPYILMNYQDSLDDLSTLAHEFGHALHSHLAMTHQTYADFRYVPFLAEIASTCNEVLLSNYLIDEAKDSQMKAALLVERLEGIRTTIYRQTLFAEFERIAHGFVEEGTPVTASLLDETYRELIQRYYGPGFSLDENDGLEWAYIPHFYYKYYVWTYATGLSSGIALAENVVQKGEPAVIDFLGMLKSGCAKPPLELLKAAGVDLTRPDAIEAALQVFDETISELESLLGS